MSIFTRLVGFSFFRARVAPHPREQQRSEAESHICRRSILLLAQTISHYRILNHLGENLIGEVYIAEDTQLGRKVVLQILSEKFTLDGERMGRLTQEARTLSTLNHPNIRMIYEVGAGAAQGATRHFIATEFVDGPNLRIHLSRRRFKLDEILDVVLQTAAGLAAAHVAGVLHRDLQ